MKVLNIKKYQIFHFVVLGIILSTVLSSIYSYSIKHKLQNDFYGMKFIVESESSIDMSLVFTYSEKFDNTMKLENLNSTSDTLFFEFPSSNKIVKKFRLDFGNNREIKPVKIKELYLLFNDEVLLINQQNVFNNLYNVSSSIKLDKKNQIVYFNEKTNPFDPYIIFSPLVELTLQKPTYTATLLVPFFALIIFLGYNHRKRNKIKILDLLIILFVACIPLKIAWTTFVTILLCFYGLVTMFLKRDFKVKGLISYFFIGLFCLLLFFGRPSSFSAIDMQLGLILFAVIGATISLPKMRIYGCYTFFMLLLNAIMLASGISFLIWFNDFYGLGIIDYYKDIKIYSGDIRSWLYYDHAAFLSFFGLIGVLFVQELYKKNVMDIKLVYLYHILVVTFIMLSATRICLMIYVVFLSNILMKINLKKRILGNLITFLVFATLLTVNIYKIDINRHNLWSVTWEAIKERPLLGHGLGESNTILQNKYFREKASASPQLDLNHSHNQFLTFLLEIGVLGLATLLFGLVYFVVKTKLYRNNTALLFLFGLAYMFLTESILQTSKPLYILCFLFLVLTTEKHTNIMRKDFMR